MHGVCSAIIVRNPKWQHHDHACGANRNIAVESFAPGAEPGERNQSDNGGENARMPGT